MDEVNTVKIKHPNIDPSPSIIQWIQTLYEKFISKVKENFQIQIQELDVEMDAQNDEVIYISNSNKEEKNETFFCKYVSNEQIDLNENIKGTLKISFSFLPENYKSKKKRNNIKRS